MSVVRVLPVGRALKKDLKFETSVAEEIVSVNDI